MPIHNKQIAIVGGGPGGLTLARLLEQNGANVKVYERDINKDVRVQGATLDLHEDSGLEALRKAGLIEAFYANYRPQAGKLKILDKAGIVHLDDHTAEDFGEQRPEIDRGPLRNILLASLKPDTVVWDSQFVSMQPQNEGWLLQFRNHTTAYADVVIAADGANSKIRSYCNPIKAVYSGITIIEGNLYNAASNAPALWKLVNGGKIFAFGDEQSLILSAKGDGCLSFYTGCKVVENWLSESNIDFSDKTQVENWFKSAFGSWNSIWLELFASNELSFVPRPQYHFPLDQYWETLPNLTLLGDAAHRMPPYAGEGVNMAMQDALELAECLLNPAFQSVQEALTAYENQMRQRASTVTQLTLESTEMLHSGNAIEQMLQAFQGVK
ncbi:FAD-dependent oxidoreductase [Emticicia sp. 17c]|uniref:FAD-dependent oxidoreductase n=1 Tax=Emticicia sp. 17c TaxID=3127704 RepID=UPI00301D04D5